MHNAPSPERFHALDATRAFALLLGVVFHAAWSFIPRSVGSATTDISSHVGFDWFFFTSHTFRMQVFYLIAGFFARMMYHRRGLSGFARNRLSRIVVPFLAGWVILAPALILTWIWAGNLSGKNLTPIPLFFLFDLLVLKGLILVPRSMNGLFTLAHLWFLYYLIWIYVAVILLRFVVMRLTGARSSARDRVDRLVAACVASPWSIFVLSVVAGLFLWRMGGWFGVDTPIRSLVPSLSVLLLYGFFFALGWLMHRQTHLLKQFGTRWKWQLVLALILSLGLYSVFHRLEKSGVAGSLASHYPVLVPNEIRDWPAFLEKLKTPATAADAPEALRHLWAKFPPTTQDRLVELSAEPFIEIKVGICDMIGKLLKYPEMFEPLHRGPDGQALPFKAHLVESKEARRAALANRHQLEALFPGIINTDARLLSWYWPAKLAFSLVYALVMWLFVFATLGFFQARCTEHSEAWRYVADSSYWVYLAHIPLVPWLHVWMAHWPWPGLVKFLLLNLVSFALLYASYHYLVRSTFIGQVLNGRRHSFVPVPWMRRAPAPPDPALAQKP